MAKKKTTAGRPTEMKGSTQVLVRMGARQKKGLAKRAAADKVSSARVIRSALVAYGIPE